MYLLVHGVALVPPLSPADQAHARDLVDLGLGLPEPAQHAAALDVGALGAAGRHRARHRVRRVPGVYLQLERLAPHLRERAPEDLRGVVRRGLALQRANQGPFNAESF